MRFNRELHKIAKKFREEELDADDKKDMTVLPDDWRKEIVSGLETDLYSTY